MDWRNEREQERAQTTTGAYKDVCDRGVCKRDELSRSLYNKHCVPDAYGSQDFIPFVSFTADEIFYADVFLL